MPRATDPPREPGQLTRTKSTLSDTDDPAEQQGNPRQNDLHIDQSCYIKIEASFSKNEHFPFHSDDVDT